MNQWILLIVGLVLGAVVAWRWAYSRGAAGLFKYQVEAETKMKAAESTISELRGQVEDLRSSLETKDREGKTETMLRVAAETRLQEVEKSLQEQKQLLDEARTKLAETFQALSGEALKSNNRAFLELARSTFETIQAQARGELETREKAIETLVGPLKEALERYEKEIRGMEAARQTAYGALDEQLRTLAAANYELQKTTGGLVSALSVPQVRGRWGELTLRRVAELAGMAEHCDFAEQETLSSEAGRLRPDMIINLPGNRRIPVDAKVPLQAFLEAASAVTVEERQTNLARHSQLVRAHLHQLATRAYWEQFDPMPEIVVLFLPGESFFAAAAAQDKTLIEDAAEKRVILATPTTLIALLRAVVHGWRLEQIRENTQVISELGKQMYDRIRMFIEHFVGLGSALEKAVAAYNKAAGSLESRVLISARKFRELGAGTGEDMLEVKPVDETLRTLVVPERVEPE